MWDLATYYMSTMLNVPLQKHQNLWFLHKHLPEHAMHCPVRQLPVYFHGSKSAITTYWKNSQRWTVNDRSLQLGEAMAFFFFLFKNSSFIYACSGLTIQGDVRSAFRRGPQEVKYAPQLDTKNYRLNREIGFIAYCNSLPRPLCLSGKGLLVIFSFCPLGANDFISFFIAYTTRMLLRYPPLSCPDSLTT